MERRHLGRTRHRIGAAEEALIRRLKRGENAAFAEAVDRYHARLMAAARRILGNEEDARDCVQETFMQLFRSIGRFEGRSSLSSWLHRIVTNAALMHVRRRCRERLADLPSSVEESETPQDAALWQIPTCPQAVVECRQLCKHVRDAIDALPEPHRNILLLRDIREEDTAATARVMGISINAAKVRLHRARRALRIALEPTLLADAHSRV
ncbi:MAG: RNA polymerase sigma factor [Pseudomonadota bacterium]